MTKLNLKKIVSITVLLTFAFYGIRSSFPNLDFWKYSIVSAIIFGLLYGLNLLHEKYLWNKHWTIRKLFFLLGFQEYPNIAGKWNMQYFSSYKFDRDNSKYTTKGNGIIEIKKINGGFSYKGNFDQSNFKSVSNFIEQNKNNKKEWIIGYTYFNEPQETKVNTTGFVNHYGFTVLNFDEEETDKISGFYGNDESRQTRGKIILTRIKKTS